MLDVGYFALVLPFYCRMKKVLSCALSKLRVPGEEEGQNGAANNAATAANPTMPPAASENTGTEYGNLHLRTYCPCLQVPNCLCSELVGSIMIETEVVLCKCIFFLCLGMGWSFRCQNLCLFFIFCWLGSRRTNAEVTVAHSVSIICGAVAYITARKS